MINLPSLYKITDEMIEVVNLLDDESSYDENGELDPVVQERFELLSKDFNQKAMSCSYIKQMYEDELAAIDREIARLNNIKKAKRRAKDNLEYYIISAMRKLNLKEIKGETRTIKLSKTEAVEVFDTTQLPENYKRARVETEPNKTKIKEDLKNGLNVQGARLVENYHLNIK